jgi:crossover junction endodeoxyribonuclease RuvC
MIVLGVDPGSRATGYGVIREENGEFSILGCGIIRPGQASCMAERLGEISVELEQVIMNFRPERSSIETAFFKRNVHSAMILGEVRGAVLALSARMGLGVGEYAPREIKSAIAGSGSASKEQVASMVGRMLKISEPLKPFDVTDALAVALCDILRSSAREGGFLKPTGRKKANAGKGWSAFVASNPELVA